MNKILFAVFFLPLGLVIAHLLHSLERDPVGARAVLGDTGESAASIHAPERQHTSADADANDEPDEAVKATADVASMTARLMDHPSRPESIEELEWLDRHGYPDKSLLDRLMRMSLEDLRAAANSGDRHARHWLGLRFGLRDSGPEPLEILFDEAASGSIYALMLLGNIHHTGHSGYRDYPLASAYYTLAGLRGDVRGMFGAGALLSSELDFSATILRDQRLVVLFNDLNRVRMERAGAPFRISVRPGPPTQQDLAAMNQHYLEVRRAVNSQMRDPRQGPTGEQQVQQGAGAQEQGGQLPRR